MQCVTLGSYADLEVLKFAKSSYTFHWEKIGLGRSVQPCTVANVLVFPCVNKEDLGYYQCDVEEGGKVVLTVYRALYCRSDSEQYSQGICVCNTMSGRSDFSQYVT